MDLDDKQQFLKVEIIDKGYDVEACQAYLVELKPDGGDQIDNWSFQELQQAIFAFQDNSKCVTQPIEEQVVPVVVQQEVGKQQNESEWPCQQCSTNELTPGDQKIKILSYKKESPGFLKSSYITFQVETQPIGWNVFRRYSDFEWLRNSLHKFFPGYILPPIHKKRLRTFDDAYLNKRRQFLERFLNDLMNTYELRSNLVLKMFLTCQSISDFKNFQDVFQCIMQSINEKQSVNVISQVRNKEGIANTLPSFETHQYIHLSQDYFNNQDAVFKKIRSLSKVLMTNQQNHAITVYNLGEQFAVLFQNISKLNQGLPSGQVQSLGSTYLNINNMMITWGNIINKQIGQTEEFFNSYFKYQQHFILSVKQFYQSRQTLQNQLETFRQKLNYKKERLFELGDTNKWELNKDHNYTINQLIENKKLAFSVMCDQETKIENNMVKMLGYYNCQTYSETQHFLKLLQKDLSNNFIKFCQVQAFNISENHLLWADVLTNLQNNMQIGSQQVNQVIVEAVG